MTDVRERIILRCKRCKTVEAHEYAGGCRVAPGTFEWVKNEKGQPITLNHDEQCPQCRRYRTLATVKGHYSASHKCGPKCLNAVGPACECQCGGQNHGAGHMS